MRGFTSHNDVTEKKLTEKFEILSSIRDHRKKSMETREIAYTCRYSEHLIPNSVMVRDAAIMLE